MWFSCCQVEVVDPKQKIVKLGAIRVNDAIRKQVPIVNNSPAPVTFRLGFTPTNQTLADRSIFRCTPAEKVTLQPRGGTMRVDVFFHPRNRISPFSEEVLIECAGMSQTLFVVTGSCQGVEVTLDTDYIPFGAVVQRSSNTRRVVMSNTGDMGARFKWDLAKFGPDFSISPVQGYIAQGMDVTFDVEFHPQELNHDIRYDVSASPTSHRHSRAHPFTRSLAFRRPRRSESVHFSIFMLFHPRISFHIRCLDTCTSQFFYNYSHPFPSCIYAISSTRHVITRSCLSRF